MMRLLPIPVYDCYSVSLMQHSVSSIGQVCRELLKLRHNKTESVSRSSRSPPVRLTCKT